MARRISATPTSASPPTRSSASCGSTGATRCSSPAWTSMGLKVQQTAARAGVTPQDFVDGVAGRVRGDGRIARRPRRRHRAHDAGAPPPLRAGDLGAHGRQRRHLSVQIFRLVLGARRGLFRGGRTDRRPRRLEARPVRRAGDLGRGGELFLPPVGLCRQAHRPLRGEPGFHHAGAISQRDRRLRQTRPQRSLGQPHHFRLGRAGARRPEACDVCLGRRADQLHHRHRLSRRGGARARNIGRRTPTSSARTSRAFTPSIGRRS